MSTKKASKSSKPRKSRPQSTLNQAPVDAVAVRNRLCSFSPNGDQFVLVSLALDKHRLRVFDVTSSRIVAEHTFDNHAQVTCLTWATLPDASGSDEPSPAKKRKKRADVDQTSTLSDPSSSAIALGLTSGAVCIFSPAHGRVLRTLADPANSSAVSAVEVARGLLYTSTTDGTLRSWNLSTGDAVDTWKRPRASCLLRSRPGDDADDLLECTHDARLVSLKSDEEITRIAGHASNIVDIAWDRLHAPPARVATCADGDRVVHVWDLPESGEGSLLATMPLDSDVVSISFSALAPGDDKQVLLAVSASGKAHLVALPSKLSKKKPTTLESQSTVTIQVKGSGEGKIACAAFRAQERGRICVVRLAEGVRPVFDTVRYEDDDGDFVAEVKVKQSDAGLANGHDSAMHATTRYHEGTTLAVHSGSAPGADASADAAAPDGHLDAAVAELSLGQRLGVSGRVSDDEEDDQRVAEAGRRLAAHRVPRASGALARTLAQALHGGDTQLLDTVLRTSDPRVVQATIRRLPAPLAVPLLSALTERLSRKRQSAAPAGAQHAHGLLAWVREVLVVHGAHLLTMPDLVARLAALHATLASRAGMQDRLLALSGRLELVLAQAALRSKRQPQKKDDPSSSATHYVEGESDEDNDEEESVEKDDEDSEAGSEEVVELGEDDNEDVDEVPASDDDADEDQDQDDDEDADEDEEDDDEEDDEDQDQDSEDGGARRVNGIIDDEAEEWDDEESDSEE